MITAARNTAHLLGCPHQDCPRVVLCEDRCAETGINREPPAIDPAHVASPTDSRETWTVCPECGIGPGEDHKRGCSRGKWASSPRVKIGLSEEQVSAAAEKKP